jgi:anaerobic magnesium-protoporphyrin IX monomethyl ester cyclase
MSKKALLIKPLDHCAYVVIPNLGLGYLAASLKKNGFEVLILDCNKGRFDMRSFEGLLAQHDFHLIGFQLYSSGLESAKYMMAEVKKLSRDSILVVGGSQPSGDPEYTLRHFLDVDCAVIGEGEKSIVELMNLSKKEAKDPEHLLKINNLAFLNEKKQLIFTKREFIDDLNTLPDPAWDLIDPRTYTVSPHGTFSKGFPVAPIITSRGCPYQCTFCGAHKIMGYKIRKRKVENVLNEIEHLQEAYGVKEFHIEDDNFTFDKNYVMELSEGILNRGLKFWWACPNGIRVDRIDAEMLRAMEKSGCYSVALGIEFGSDRMLRAVNKNLSVSTIEERVAFIKRNSRLRLTGNFLMGYPGETEEEIKQTIELSLRLPIDKANFIPVMPLPGSHIYEEWKKKFCQDAEIWNYFLYYQFVPGVSAIDEKLLYRYLRQAVMRFYLRPRIISGFVREIRTLNQLKVLLKRIKAILSSG